MVATQNENPFFRCGSGRINPVIISDPGIKGKYSASHLIQNKYSENNIPDKIFLLLLSYHLFLLKNHNHEKQFFYCRRLPVDTTEATKCYRGLPDPGRLR